MNILLITPQLPWPPHQGATLRNFHIIKGLAQNHAITLLSFKDTRLDGQEQHDLGPLVDLCEEIVTVFVPKRSKWKRLWQLITTLKPDMEHRLASTSFNVALHELLQENRFDLVQIEGIELARSIEIIRETSPDSYIVFDNHNAETALQQSAMEVDWKRPSRILAALYSWVQVNRLGRFEAWACVNADAVTVVSDQDKKALQQLIQKKRAMLPQREIRVIPNCIDVELYQRDGELEPFDIVFTGKMDYRPNVDAALWFADEVWPLIRAKAPDTTCAIVGQKPHASLNRLHNVPGMVLTGRVKTVVPYMHGAQVFIMPLRMGSGTRLKLIEAMAAGIPVVSTPLGSAGYDVVDGHHVLIGEKPSSFARAVCQLLNDKALSAAISDAGKTFAIAYDWRMVIPRFDRLAQSLVRPSQIKRENRSNAIDA